RGPRLLDLRKATLHALPQVLRNDAKAVVGRRQPLRLWFRKLPAATGLWISPRLAAVPDPRADVLTIPEESMDRGRGPALRTATADDPFSVQHPYDPRLRPPARETLEDTEDHRRLSGLDDHPISLGSLASLLVDSNGADRNGSVSKR